MISFLVHYLKSTQIAQESADICRVYCPVMRTGLLACSELLSNDISVCKQCQMTLLTNTLLCFKIKYDKNSLMYFSCLRCEMRFYHISV